jgi:hypothetical protein
MYRHSTHLALARARQEELLHEAEQRRLARLVANDERPGLVARLAVLLRRRRAGRPAAAAHS